MEVFLNAWLPRFLPGDCTFRIHPYRGKHALLRKIGSRLQGYVRWIPAEYRIVVVVDLDSDNCEELKATLEQFCEDAGLRSRRTDGGPDWQVVTRIVVQEIEAWYFGGWEAVRRAYPRVSAKIPQQARYRNPDAINNAWEAFEKILQKGGYFRQGLAKAQAAARIGEYFDPKVNGSRSFTVFRDAIAAVATESTQPRIDG